MNKNIENNLIGFWIEQADGIILNCAKRTKGSQCQFKVMIQKRKAPIHYIFNYHGYVQYHVWDSEGHAVTYPITNEKESSLKAEEMMMAHFETCHTESLHDDILLK